MYEYFRTANLKSLYGGWVLYRNGEMFAWHFASKGEAKKYAENFCKLNGYQFVWSN